MAWIMADKFDYEIWNNLLSSFYFRYLFSMQHNCVVNVHDTLDFEHLNWKSWTNFNVSILVMLKIEIYCIDKIYCISMGQIFTYQNFCLGKINLTSFNFSNEKWFSPWKLLIAVARSIVALFSAGISQLNIICIFCLLTLVHGNEMKYFQTTLFCGLVFIFSIFDATTSLNNENSFINLSSTNDTLISAHIVSEIEKIF